MTDFLPAKYEYARIAAGAFGLMDAPMAWTASIGKYLDRSFKPPTDNWNAIEPLINRPDGIWKFFLCPSAGTLETATFDSNGIRVVSEQGTILLVNYLGERGWKTAVATNLDYVANEGVLGFDNSGSVGAPRRLQGRMSSIRKPSQVALITDGKKRAYQEVPLVPAFQLWSPQDGSPTEGNTGAAGLEPRALTLADTFADPPLVSGVSNFDTLRHKSKINIAFADGHVETRTISPADLADVYILPPP
jgi:prepilin-type processing-associated H-X9-DG protein